MIAWMRVAGFAVSTLALTACPEDKATSPQAQDANEEVMQSPNVVAPAPVAKPVPVVPPPANPNAVPQSPNAVVPHASTSHHSTIHQHVIAKHRK